MGTKRVKGKKKLKSIKAKQTNEMGSKRRLAKMGKEQRKGMRGIAANYITRSQALKRLQIPLKDFRRLCILKGVYPRDPKKQVKGKDKTYYYLKDIIHLAHEPLLNKFREFKAFMKKVKRAAGRNNIEDARRRYAAKPTYTLDHIVKERYPQFSDALGDLDDALCLIHLFAFMPAKKGISSERTEQCVQLVREWQNYVMHSHTLTKVFVSIKGIYYQAKIHGQDITWLVPHQFTPKMDKHVDMRIMLTFVEIYEVLLKFVMYKLYSDMELVYPPVIDLKLDQMGSHLNAIKLEQIENESNSIKKENDEENIRNETTEQQEASEQRLQTLNEKIKDISNQTDEDEDDDMENPLDKQDVSIVEPLEAAFASNELATKLHQVQREEEAEGSLFKNCRFFLSREIPQACLEFVIRSHGGQVGYEGEGSPYNEKSDRITHHLVDRPTHGHRYFTREYVQPQWVLDSVNCKFLLPIDKYLAGVSLPPHLSPFVDDEKEGYIPTYRKKLNELKSAAQEIKDINIDDGASSEDDEETYEKEMEQEITGRFVRAIKRNDDSDDDDEDEDDEEDIDDDGEDEDEDEDEDDEEDDDVEEEEEEEEDSNSKDIQEEPSPNVESKKNKAKRLRAEEEKELHDMAKNMMSKKARRLYDRMQYGLGKKASKIEALEEKRRQLEGK